MSASNVKSNVVSSPRAQWAPVPGWASHQAPGWLAARRLTASARPVPPACRSLERGEQLDVLGVMAKTIARCPNGLLLAVQAVPQ
jgi:hypothetical protein